MYACVCDGNKFLAPEDDSSCILITPQVDVGYVAAQEYFFNNAKTKANRKLQNTEIILKNIKL